MHIKFYILTLIAYKFGLDKTSWRAHLAVPIPQRHSPRQLQLSLVHDIRNPKTWHAVPDTSTLVFSICFDSLHTLDPFSLLLHIRKGLTSPNDVTVHVSPRPQHVVGPPISKFFRKIIHKDLKLVAVYLGFPV